MDSKLLESNHFGKKCKDQIENLLQNESDLKTKFENLKEENAALKLNSNRFVIKSYKYLNLSLLIFCIF